MTRYPPGRRVPPFQAPIPARGNPAGEEVTPIPMQYRPVEVEVRDSLEKAMKVLKQRMSKEGILQELKRRRFYEKPSVKRKRKIREAAKRRRKERRRKPT